jgi:hypothetical protein
LAVACDHRVTTGIGARRADDLAGRLPARVWARHPAGIDATGRRWYDWALIDITDPDNPGELGEHALLIRRSIRTRELAFYRRHTPPGAAGHPGRRGPTPMDH